ncbi:MAG: hypothetical protein EA353_06935 [Puniceicoccaceae bacterium]|nr:MAG: hypothetical protein EA353_06935 [Puniceicoccaceae bacterium]
MNQPIISFFTAGCLLFSASWAAPLNSYLEDDVAIHASFRSLAEARSSWAAHPFAELIENPELQNFFEPLMEASKQGEDSSFTEVMEDAFGLTWDSFFELFPGQISISLFNLSDLLLQQAERPDLVIMAEFTGDADRLAELMGVQFERNAAKQKEANPAIEHVMLEEFFMGETLHLDEVFDGENTYIEDGYALVDGIFILATPETRLRAMVEAIKEGPRSPLIDTVAYQRSRELGGRGDFSLYLNLRSFLPALNQALLNKSMESGAAMFGLSAPSLDKALGLESLQAVFFDLDLIETGLSSHNGILYREKTGLTSLLTYRPGPLPEAGYVPETIYSSSVSTFDFGAMLAQLEKLIGSASPTMPMLIDMQMQTMRSQTGVDFRSSILENFGGSMVSLAALPEGRQDAAALLQPEQVFVVELRDAEALSSGIRALIDLVPGGRELIEEQRFAGQTIHTIRVGANPATPEVQSNDVSYVITRSHLIFNLGDASLLKEVLTRMESGESGFWQKASTNQLFEPIAMERAVTRSYVDLEQMVVPVFVSIVTGSQYGSEGTRLDAANIPRNLAVPFHVITEMNEAADGIFSRSLLIQREAAR